MRKILNWLQKTDETTYSTLHDQNTFYKAFLSDIRCCQKELIIESPFITSKRMNQLLPELKSLRFRGIKILVNTRNPLEHQDMYRTQAEDAVAQMQAIGIRVLYTSGHHRKLAIIDRQSFWEGSLNILSYNDSCEIMRKITSTTLAEQLVKFTEVGRYLKGV